MQPPPSARDILVLAQIVDLVRAGTAATRPEAQDGHRPGAHRRERPRGRGHRIRHARRGRCRAVRSAPRPAVAQHPLPHRGRRDPGSVLGALMHTAVTDLDGRDLTREFRESTPRTGRRRCCAPSHDSFRRLLRRLDEPAPVWAVVVGLPGPRTTPTGRVAAPRTIPGWAGRRPAPGSPPTTTHRSGSTTRSTSRPWASGAGRSAGAP